MGYIYGFRHGTEDLFKIGQTTATPMSHGIRVLAHEDVGFPARRNVDPTQGGAGAGLSARLCRPPWYQLQRRRAPDLFDPPRRSETGGPRSPHVRARLKVDPVRVVTFGSSMGGCVELFSSPWPTPQAPAKSSF